MDSFKTTTRNWNNIECHHYCSSNWWSLPIYTPSGAISNENNASYLRNIVIRSCKWDLLIANLGPGPRDGLMTGCQRGYRPANWPGSEFLELTVISIGWYLGGTVGIGTVIFAFGLVLQFQQDCTLLQKFLKHNFSQKRVLLGTLYKI